MHDPLPRDDYQPPLAPARVTAPPIASGDRPASGHWTRGLALGALAVLGLGVVAVFLWLPRWVASPPAPASPPAATATVTATLTVTASGPVGELLLPEPPEARGAAQDALAALLPQVEALRAQRVETWDAAALQQIEAALADGEQAYREQRFTAARDAYARAARLVADTTARIPDAVADALDEGERALLSQDARAAETAFARALALAPDNADAARGLRRAEAFDKVMALLNEASGYERMGDTTRAAAAYRAALQLDPAAGTARQALQRIEQARIEAAYADQMSQGFTALQAGEFATAETAFTAAARLRPAAADATNALAQTRARATAAKIEAALAAAARAERAEQWREAGARFEAARTLDPALAVATQGAARAAARARLEQRLREPLARPERLADAAVAGEVEATLREARAVPQPGPRLTAQIGELASALAAARTPLEVTVQSDGETAVSIQRVGHLGQLTARKVSLLPGRYTALGTRDGYRDARVEFTVAADAAPPIITVQCREALSFGR